MGDPEPPKRRSDILDAIFEQVADQPERSETANLIFRPNALAQLDVAAEIDNQLPLVSRRSWLLLVGVVLLLAGFGLWAAVTPSVRATSAMARVANSPGAIVVAAPGDGTLVAPLPPGTRVRQGQVLARVRTGGTPLLVRATAAGTIWQALASAGDAMSTGAQVASILPAGSDREVLVVLGQEQAGGIVPGLVVRIAGTDLVGRVTAISAPMPAADAAARTALGPVPGSYAVIVTAQFPEPLPAGSLVAADVVLSQSTVLERIWGQS